MRIHTRPAFQIMAFVLATLAATGVLVMAGLNESDAAQACEGHQPCAAGSAR